MQLPAFASSPASLEFHRRLVEEHIDEASFLYEQRRAMLSEIDEPWARVAGMEQRLEAHLDALAVAGRGALDACVARAIDSGEPGARFVAACVACRRRDSKRLAQLLDCVQDGDASALAPLRDALRLELSDDWMPLIVARLSATKPAWVELFADIARPGQPQVARALLKAVRHRIAVASVADAVGRLKIEAAREDLWPCLDDQPDETRAAALLALCRIGDAEAALHGASAARNQPWARTAVGVSGDRVAVGTLMQVAHDGAIDKATIEALGLLGDPEAAPVLLSALARDDLAACAARSLHWITGAGLFVEVFVPDPVDEAAMGPSELENWKTRQEQPTRMDGQPFGEKVCMLSRDPQRWERWLAEHDAQFRPGWRYRAGRPSTPRVTVECLADPGVDGSLRRAAALELEIRYGCRIPFDVEMPVVAQRAALTRMLAWADAQGDRFAPGAWTPAGSTS